MNELGWLLLGIGLGLLLGLGGWWSNQQGFSFMRGKASGSKFINLAKTPKPLIPIKESLHGQALLVPIRYKAGYPAHAVQAGLELALHSAQSLHVVVFIEVPRTLNLESGLDDELEAAFQIIEQAESAAQKAGITIVSNVAKVRNYILAVVETAFEIKAGLIIGEQSSNQFSLSKVSLVNQAEMLGNKTGCNILLLNPSRLPDNSTFTPLPPTAE